MKKDPPRSESDPFKVHISEIITALVVTVSARREPDTGRDRAEGADVPAQTEGNLHLLLHVESRAVRILRQFWGLQVPRHAIKV